MQKLFKIYISVSVLILLSCLLSLVFLGSRLLVRKLESNGLTMPISVYIVEYLHAPREDTIRGIIPELELHGYKPHVIQWALSTDEKLRQSTLIQSNETYSVVVRVNPPSQHKDFDSNKFWSFVDYLSKSSTIPMATSEVMLALADKNLLTKIGNLSYGLSSTKLWQSSSKNELINYLKNLKEPRIFKPRWYGRLGAGILLLRPRPNSTIEVTDVVYNKVDIVTSTKAAEECLENGDVIDMRFLPGISFGETRLLMSGEQCVGIVRRATPKGRYIAVGGTSWDAVPINDTAAIALRDEFIESLGELRTTLGLQDGTTFPPVWTADFIPDKKTVADQYLSISDHISDEKTFLLGEINAMAVGHTAFPGGFKALGQCFVGALAHARTGVEVPLLSTS